MMRHKDDDAATLEINLSTGATEVDGEPMLAWFVPLGTCQPEPDQRKARLVAQLLAYAATEYACQSIGVLQAELEAARARSRA